MKPELRFPEFKNEWKLENLGNLADIVRGASPRPIKDSKWFDDNSDIGWLRISDVTQQNGKIKFLQQHLSTEGQKKTRVLYEPHLLLSIAASVGKPVINYVKTGVHDGFLIFMKPKFDLYFMFNWLENFQLKWKKYGQPGSQVNLNSDLVKSQNIYIPYSYEEEEKMGTFFSKLDRQIELEEQKLAKLEEQKKGYMQKIFSQELRFKDGSGNEYPEWEDVKLQNIANIKKGEQIKKENIDNNGKYYHLNGGTTASSRTNLFNTNPFTISISEGGNSCGFIKMNKEYFFSGGHNYTLLDLSVSNFYLYSYLKYHEKKIMSLRVGSGLPNIQKKDISNYLIKIPRKEEQEKIGSFFKNLDEFIEKQANKVELLKQRKQSFLQKMFV